MSNKKRRRAKTIELVPQSDFEDAVRKVLSHSKQESDRQLAEFQASNKARREAKRPCD